MNEYLKKLRKKQIEILTYFMNSKLSVFKWIYNSIWKIKSLQRWAFIWTKTKTRNRDKRAWSWEKEPSKRVWEQRRRISERKRK